MKASPKSLKRVLVAGVVAISAILVAGVTTAAGRDATSAASSADCKTLRILVWEGYADPSFVKPFEKQYGVKVKPTYIASVDEEVAKMVSGGTKQYEVITASSDNRKLLVDAKVIEPIDVSKIPNYANLYPFVKPMYTLNGKVWAVSQDWGINPFIYDKSLFKTPPTNWKVQWSPKLKNKVAIWNDYTLLYMGASVLGIDSPPGVYNLSDKQLAAIKAKMLELKPNVRAVWSTGGDVIQMFATKEVSATLGWNYVYTQLIAKKVNVGQTVFPHMGPQAWNDANAISSGISDECRTLAYKWIDYLSSPKAQAQIAKVTGYGVSNPSAKKHMSAALIKQTYVDKPFAYLKRAYFRTDPVRRSAYIKTANEILAGLK